MYREEMCGTCESDDVGTSEGNDRETCLNV